MTDPIEDAVGKAVAAVQERQRKIVHGLQLVVVSLTIVIIVAAVGIIYAARWIVDEQTSTQNAITCALAAETQTTTQYLQNFSKKFGGPLPPIPGLPHQCGGNDPVFVGTTGNDTIYGTTDPDWINGEEGNDTLYARGGGDTLIGYKGSDTLYGGTGSDYLYGGDGNDQLHAGGDAKVDHLDGGAGTDTCYARVNDVLTSCERVIRTS